MDDSDPPSSSSEVESSRPEPAAQAEVSWYHRDPGTPFQELRLGAVPGVTRALLLGVGLAIAIGVLMLVVVWFGWLSRPGNIMPVPN